MASQIDIVVKGNFRVIQQPKDANICWAIVATIMQSWKTGLNPTIRSVIGSIDKDLGFLELLDGKLSLENQDLPAFLAAMGLIAEPPQSFSVQAIANLLSMYGPIWVTADEDLSKNFAAHARVIIGLKGDGTPQNTIATIIDPNFDSLIFESVELLQEKFTQLAIGDNEFGDNSAQFIHF